MIDRIKNILTKALKSFVTSNLLVDEKKIGNALRTSILYTQKYLMDNSYMNNYNTGVAVTLLLFFKKKVFFVSKF